MADHTEILVKIASDLGDVKGAVGEVKATTDSIEAEVAYLKKDLLKRVDSLEHSRTWSKAVAACVIALFAAVGWLYDRLHEITQIFQNTQGGS